MRRHAHPPDARTHFLIAPRPAAAATLLALALTLATGALRSPFLLVLPLLALVLLVGTTRSEARWVLGFGALALLAGQAAADSLTLPLLAATLLGAAVLHVLAERLRRVLALRSPAAATPDGPEPAAPAARVQELRELVERTCAWTGAVALTVWRCAEGVARPVVASGRALPPARILEGDPLGWVAREGTPLWVTPTPGWSEPGFAVAVGRLRAGTGEAWLATTEYAAEQLPPAHEDLAAAHGALRLFIDVLAAREHTEAAQRRLDQLLALLRRIPVALEPAGFGRELLDAAMALTRATGGTLAAWSDESGEVIVTAGGDGGPQPGARLEAPASELALAVRAGTTLERTAGRWRPGRTQLATDTDRWLRVPRTLVCAPLTTPAGVVGVMGLWSSHADRLEAQSLELLQAVLPYAALHLAHAREVGRLRDHADRDPLTGLLNRRGFEAALSAERQRFERYGHPLSVLMLDIDHFKSINDRHGHDAGDAVLRTLAAVLRTALRDVDVVARHGGEEFVVLLPETPAAAAAEVAERVRAAVADAQVHAGGVAIPVRVSIGVSSCPELVIAPTDLLASADAALYEAKRTGRDCVIQAARAPRVPVQEPPRRSPRPL